MANIPCYFGLPADGVAGPDTYFLFGQGVGPHTTYGGPVYGSRQLGPGTSGKEGIILQNRLNCFQAFSTGRPAPGTFDNASAEAVLAFKRQTESNGAPACPPIPSPASGSTTPAG
ncbi:protein of unknown function [Candidatus Hydrogenisulfobacillus filiaventi]|uniref:Peptidoglycan binding-like domain-containing protein n=1 Tax=Candidatus Hydrogenisulfobacillus filiaventi TaxID=2707344 RepID=A0A6F8ZHF3_9FIRM|nr:protein of unknown function [Candidatus Hydrogenisulfobacillus filiaventi]